METCTATLEAPALPKTQYQRDEENRLKTSHAELHTQLKKKGDSPALLQNKLR
jgi:hypothetical protein